MKRVSSVSYLIFVLILSLFILQTSHGQSVIKILPLGNSITEGEDSFTDKDPSKDGIKISYRYTLSNLLNGAGIDFDFVGHRYHGYSYPGLDCDHAGVSGTRDQYLEQLLRTGYDATPESIDEGTGGQITTGPYLDVYQPDIILLHVGTNDCTHETEPSTSNRMSAILDLVDEYETRSGKEVIVILALIINRMEHDAKTSRFNDAVKTMALARKAAGDNIVIVDMENGAGFYYDSRDMIDWLHPNTTGYNKMAQAWYQAIIANYNTPPVVSTIPNQTKTEGEPFDVINLDNYVDDAESPDESITWSFEQLTTSFLNITINASRQVTITPKDPEWSGSQQVEFTATDPGLNGGFQKSDAVTVTFTVTGTPDPPVITGQKDINTLEDVNLVLKLKDFTIEDPDSDPSSFQLKLLNGEHYAVNGSFVIPEKNYDHDLNVNIAVSDGSGQGPTYSALIHVIPVNDPPVYLGQNSVETNEDTPYDLSFDDIMFEDYDTPLEKLTLQITEGYNYKVNGTRVIPDENFSGRLYVDACIVDDSGSKSNDFNIAIDVKGVNDKPEFTCSPVSIAKRDSIFIYRITAFDADNDQITYSAVEYPDWLQYYESTQLLGGTPKEKDLGYHYFKLKISDGKEDAYLEFYLQVVNHGSTSLEDIQNRNTPYIYPNPVKNQLNVFIDRSFEQAQLFLYNVEGSLVINRNIESEGVNQLDISSDNLSSGLYFYQIRVDKKSYLGKLSVK